MTPLFWIITALDALLFAVLLIAGLAARGGGIADGGREMSLFFFVLVPGIIVGGGVLLFVKSESSVWRAVALVIVAGPGLLLGLTRLRSVMIDYEVQQNANGSGYFSGRDAKAAGRAVVRRDTAALRTAAKGIDVSAAGARGMTLMELAMTRAWEGPPQSNAGASSLDVVRELVALGANPNAGLEIATKVSDAAILEALLDAGAKPDHANDRGPVVFEWLAVMPVANFTALLDHGMSPDIANRNGTPLIIEAGRADRWDLVLLLMARGADAARGDAQGMRLADVVQSRTESTTPRPADMQANIARVKSLLSAHPSPHAAR
jgi:ankyrin repeat protein